MIHENDDSTTSENPRMFAALNILEHVTPPLSNSYPPFWRPALPDPHNKVLIPSWNWTAGHHVIPDGDETITCDYNGAYLAAIGSVEIAHSQLKHIAQGLDAYDLDPRKVPVGYYLIDVFRWGLDSTLCSPLGTSPRLKTESRVWVAHPTLILLLELLQEGTLSDVMIHDAWLTQRTTTFRGPKSNPSAGWIFKLKQARNGLLDNIAKADTDKEIIAAQARYDAFKEGYGAALSMMLTGEKCKTRRPDWAHAVYAQHAATSWRKAWRFSLIGPVIGMGATDEITVLQSDLRRAIAKPQPPVRWDSSGRQLGHLKKKEKKVENQPQQADQDTDLVMSDTFEDVL